MPTLKPKMTFVFSSEKTKNFLDAIIEEEVSVNETNKSWEMERALINAYVSQDGDFAEVSITRLYQGPSTVKEELSRLFSDNSEGFDFKAKNDDLRPLVELAGRQSIGSVLDISLGKKIPDPLPHLRACWSNVCVKLKRAIEEERSTNRIDFKVAQELMQALEENVSNIEAKAFFDLVLRNWEVLGDYTYTFRALMDIVDIADSWPNDAKARRAFRTCVRSISCKRNGQ